MKKLNDLHQIAVEEAEYEVYPHSAVYRMDWVKAAKSCSEITKDIAIKFAEHCFYNSLQPNKPTFNRFIKTLEL